MHSSRKIMLQILLFALCITSSCSSMSDIHNKIKKNQDNFLIIDHLNDNEKETRFKWKDLLGKETTIDIDDKSASVKYNSSLQMTALWQLTDGQSFAQLIFSGNNLIDCEYLEDGQDAVSDFTEKFISDYQFIKHKNSDDSKHFRHHQYHESSNIADEIKSNVTFIKLRKLQEMPEKYLELMNMKRLKNKCNKLHKQIKQRYMNTDELTDDMEPNMDDIIESKGRTKRQADSWFIAPHTKWCGRGSSAKNYQELGPSSSDKCCRRHDLCKIGIPGLQTKWGLFNVRPFTISHCRCDRSSRRRRDLNNFLIVPYTKWCGKGWTANKYSEIGPNSKSDRCCRKHDFCSLWIGGFEQKWSLFNWSINTIMHCSCDKRFRTCLKMSDSSDANMVGKLFFNIVQIKCFVLKPEKACILYSWWGKCLKFKIKKRAYLRDNQKY